MLIASSSSCASVQCNSCNEYSNNVSCDTAVSTSRSSWSYATTCEYSGYDYGVRTVRAARLCYCALHYLSILSKDRSTEAYFRIGSVQKAQFKRFSWSTSSTHRNNDGANVPPTRPDPKHTAVIAAFTMHSCSSVLEP
jgi:hypothetical protein